ncbi:MAG: hypothetical protein ACI8YQ_003908 [Polaribacter sp.]|jgi:hypothetical protein
MLLKNENYPIIHQKSILWVFFIVGYSLMRFKIKKPSENNHLAFFISRISKTYFTKDIIFDCPFPSVTL